MNPNPADLPSHATRNPVDQSGPVAYNADPEAKPMFSLPFSTPTARIRRPPVPAIRPGEGVKDEVKKKPAQSIHRVGIVAIREKKSPKLQKTFFELRYVDPDTGYEVKRRLSGMDLDEAKAVANHLNEEAYRSRGYLAAKVPTIEEGIVEALRLSRGRDTTKIDLAKRAEPFLRFLAEHYPALKTWADLRPGMAEAYLRACERAGLAYDTIRLRLAPVKMAWRRMHQDYPERVKAPATLKLTAPPRREIQCLDESELAILLDWLKAHAPDLWPMACLQALTGLRMLEAAALRAQDVDLENKTITVTDTGPHRPKTRDSYRTIPVCGEVVEALRSAMTSQKVRPASGELFTNRKGNLWVKDALGHRWRRALRHAAARPKRINREGTGKKLTLNPNGLNLPRLAIPPHRLRATFATMASRLGVQDRILKAYLGHSSGDILGSHYRHIDLNELRLVSNTMDGWRETASKVRFRKQSGNNPAKDVVNG